MTEKRKTQAFISYSRKNKAFVRKLNAALDEAGINAWVDWEGIPLTADWMASITSAIEASDALIFVISPDSAKSKYCYKELEIALQFNKKIVPVLYSEPNGSIKLHEKLASTNWVFLRPKKERLVQVLPNLIEAIQTDLDWVQQHTNLLQRAVQWKQKKENSSYLLSGSSLEEAERWLAESTLDVHREVTPLQAEYLRASRKYASRRQRNFTLTFGVMLAVSLIALMFAIRLWYRATESEQAALESQREAEQSAEFANAQRQLADESLLLAMQKENEAKAQRSAAQARTYSQRPSEMDTSILLALEAMNRSSSQEAVDVLRDNISLMPLPVAQLKHTGRIWNLTLSADGQAIVSASADKTACVWSLSGEKKYCVEHAGVVTDALVTSDSSILITGSKDGTVRFWNFNDGTHITTFDLSSPVLDLDLNLKNTFLVAGREDEQVSVIDVKNQRSAYVFNFSNGPVSVVRFHPNGDWISIGTSEGRVRLWKIMTSLLESGPRHEAEIFNVIISPNGKVSVSVSADSSARISRAESGRQTHVLKHPDWVEDAAFSPDSSWFVTVSDDKIVRVFDTETGDERLRMYHGSFVQKVTVSPNGEWIATTGYDLTARVWDSQTGALKLEASLDGIGSAVRFSQDGDRLIVGDQDGNLTIWDISSLKQRANFIAFSEFVNRAKFDPAGQWLLANPDDKTLRQFPIGDLLTVRDGERGKPVLTFDELSAQLTVSPDSKWVAVSIDSEVGNSRALLYNLETKIEHSLPHSSNISGLAISADSRYLATANEDNTYVYIWDIETGQQFNVIPFEESVFTTAYSPKDAILAIGLTGKTILWDTETNQQLASLRQAGSIRSITFNLEGNWLATTTAEGSIFVWDMNQNPLSTPAFQFGQAGRITSLDFNSQRQWLASASEEGVVYLWDLNTGEEVTRIPHGDLVSGISFSPDGNFLSTVSRKTVQFWDLNQIVPVTSENLTEMACSRLVRNLNRTEWEFFFNEDPYQELCLGLP